MEAERLIRGPIKLGGQESSRIVPMCTVITQITWPDFCGGVFLIDRFSVWFSVCAPWTAASEPSYIVLLI